MTNRLYRETHESFKAFAKDEFHISAGRIYQLVNHVDVLDATSTIVDAPLNEAQTRELAPISKEHWKPVIKATVAKAKECGKPITAAMIKKVIGQIVKEDEGEDDEPVNPGYPASMEEPGDYEDVENATTNPGDPEDSFEEPAIKVNQYKWKTARNQIVKTLEKVQRMIDELNETEPSRWKHNAIKEVQKATKTMRGWDK